MDTREDILGRLRASLGRNVENAATGRAGIVEYLEHHVRGPLPRPQDDVVMSFIGRSKALSSTVDEVLSMEAVPDTVARYLETNGLALRAVCWAELAELDWPAVLVGVEPRPARGEDLVGITGCFCAIAETGTLMLCSGSATAASTSLLPETHIAIVQTKRIVPCMEDAWALLRAEYGGMPRAVNFVSGPSRTGDIEQTIVLGAHGPYRVHIIVVHA